MSATEKTDNTTSAAELKPATARTTPRASSRLLSVVNGKEQRSLHLSPILQQIKDDGPAVIDGEVVPDVAAAMKNEAKTKVIAAATPTSSPAPNYVLQPKHARILFGFCAALVVALSCSLWLSWRQHQQLDAIEYLLERVVAQEN